MDVTISVRRAANDGGMRWLVLATIAGACPGSPRHCFAIAVSSESEALGVVSDMLDLVSHHARRASWEAGPVLEATPADPERAVHGPHDVETWFVDGEAEVCR
jgi:hypothetical protein